MFIYMDCGRQCYQRVEGFVIQDDVLERVVIAVGRYFYLIHGKRKYMSVRLMYYL